MDRIALDGFADGEGWDAAVPIGFLDQLSRTTSQDDVFATFARWTHEILDCDRATVAIFDSTQENLCLMAIEGNQAISTGTTIPLKGSFFGESHKTLSGGYLHNIGPQKYYECARLVAGGINSIANAPMVVHDRCFGYLAIGSRLPQGAGPREVTILGALARCMASYLLLHEQITHLSDLVLKDPLTRLYNRRFYEETIASAWESWHARGHAFSIVMIDIDHFKQLNDEYGHPFGDKVLVEVAARIRDEARPQDAVIRMGGEEFAIILTGATDADAAGVAERVRRRVSEKPVQSEDRQVTVTISAGVASTDPRHPCHDAMTLLADMALYEAKAAGRNCVRAAPPGIRIA